jgi:addiction module RelE/StbE family toxin
VARVRWSEEATDNLLEITDFLGNVDPAAAEVFAKRVQQAVEQLGLFPKSGQVVSDFALESFRELIIGSFRLVYLVFSDDEVNIVSLRAGPRRSH